MKVPGEDTKLALLDRQLAVLLSYGTLAASAVIMVGLVLPLFSLPSAIGHVPVVTVGVAGIILLPVVRVLTMCLSFLHARDFVFAAIASFVLAIIVLSFVIGAVTD